MYPEIRSEQQRHYQQQLQVMELLPFEMMVYVADLKVLVVAT